MGKPAHIEAIKILILHQLIQKFITIYYTEFISSYLLIPISASNSSIFHFLTSFPAGFSTKDTVLDRVSPLM